MARFAKFCKFLAGSFSAVSKRNFARKYAFDSIFQVLQDLHPFAPLESNRKTMKSASGKRPPDNAHGAPEKKQSSRSNYALLHRSKLKLFANVGDLFDKMLTKSMSKFANVGQLLAKIVFSFSTCFRFF